MRRPRKDYRLDREPTPTPDPSPAGLVVIFSDPAGGKGQRFDFGEHGEHPIMAAELALAFRGHLADKSAATRTTAFTMGVRSWFRFLESDSMPDREVRTMSDADSDVLRVFIAWLDRRPLTPGSRHTIWSSFKQLVGWLRRHRPELLPPDLEIPYNAFLRKNAAAQPRAALTRAELDAVLPACRQDIEESWDRFEEGRALWRGSAGSTWMTSACCSPYWWTATAAWCRLSMSSLRPGPGSTVSTSPSSAGAASDASPAFCIRRRRPWSPT